MDLRLFDFEALRELGSRATWILEDGCKTGVHDLSIPRKADKLAVQGNRAVDLLKKQSPNALAKEGVHPEIAVSPVNNLEK